MKFCSLVIEDEYKQEENNICVDEIDIRQAVKVIEKDLKVRGIKTFTILGIWQEDMKLEKKEKEK